MSDSKPSIASSSIVAAIVIFILLLYIISPIDLIPDIIPVIGWVDDLVALAMIVTVAMSMLN